MLKDVKEAVGLVKEAIENTRAIVEAVNDGKKYLERYHPQAYPDLSALLEEMSKTLKGLAKVSGVVTGFQFTVEGPGRRGEPARFNQYVVEKEEEIPQLRENRSDLKGSCERIREHREALDEQAEEHWSGWALFLGEKRKQQRENLSRRLNRLYADDRYIIYLIDRLMAAAEEALDDVRAALGSGSRSKADPENVPKAADLLEEYSASFKPLRDECLDLANSLRQLVKSMRPAPAA